MKELVKGIELEKVKPVVVVPEVDKFIDAATEIVNDIITLESPAKLFGDLLKIDPADPAQGIYFKDDKGKETKVSLTMYNMPSQLIFMVPALTKGTYKVMVRAMT